MKISIRTLHQHFRNAGSATKISIDLKRRMRIKEVVICSATSFICTYRRQLVLNKFIGMIAILHPCPPIDFPTHAPPGWYIATLNQCILSSTVKFRSAVRRYLVGRKQTIEMRNMPVMIVWIINIIKPFLQLTILTNMHWRQPTA